MMKRNYEKSIGRGWLGLVEPLIEQAEKEGTTIVQIKEKFGGLRFYVVGGSDDLHEKISVAEAGSFHICEDCGAPGKPRRGGWIKTLCDDHAKT
jgi:hypothetical protein